MVFIWYYIKSSIAALRYEGYQNIIRDLKPKKLKKNGRVLLVEKHFDDISSSILYSVDDEQFNIRHNLI